MAARIAQVRARIAAAAERSGRSPAEVTLIGVSKGQPAALAAEAWRHGLSDLGENRVQEGTAKAAAVAALGAAPRWHLIGHLQGNKAGPALETFPVIHSVDTERLLRRISHLARRPVDLLIEVNVSGEASKQGTTERDAAALVELGRTLPNLSLIGLMTVAPHVGDAEEVRPVFRRLRDLGASLDLPHLSMGMTNDFEVAIEEGATLLRVGRAIFGERAG
jgi:hypothetical protein